MASEQDSTGNPPKSADLVFTNLSPQVPSTAPDSTSGNSPSDFAVVSDAAGKLRAKLTPNNGAAAAHGSPLPPQLKHQDERVELFEHTSSCGVPEIVGQKCRGAPGLDSEPVVVDWEVVKKVVFHRNEKAKTPARISWETIKTAVFNRREENFAFESVKVKDTHAPDGNGANVTDAAAGAISTDSPAAGADVKAPRRHSFGMLGGHEAEDLQGFDVKREVHTIVISNDGPAEEAKGCSKMMRYMHHMKDTDISAALQSHRPRHGLPVIDDEELEIQQSVLHLKSLVTRTQDPHSLWENFEIVSTHLLAEEGQPKGDCHGFGPAAPVLRQMNMAFRGDAFIAQPVAISGDYRFGALVSKRHILVRRLNGGHVLCDFPMDEGEEVTMLSFSQTGDLLLGVMRKQHTSYIKVWSVITADTLKVLNRREIFTKGCLALASVSSDETKIFVLVARPTGAFRLAVFSLAANTPTKPLDVSPERGSSARDLAIAEDTTTSRNVSLPFNPFQFFIFECGEETVKGPTGTRKAWKWSSLLRHRVSDVHSQDKAVQAADLLLQNMKEAKIDNQGMGMVSSDASRDVFCQVFAKQPQFGVHHFEELEHNTGAAPGGSVPAPKDQQNVIRLDKRPASSYAACVPDDTTVALWDDAGELCHLWSHSRRVTCIDVSQDGAVVVVGVSGKEEAAGVHQNIEMAKVVVYSLITLEEIYSWSLPQDVQVAKLDYLKPNRRLLLQYDGEDDWVQLRMDEMEAIPYLTGVSAGLAVAAIRGKQMFPDSIAITNDGFFFFAMTTVGSGSKRMQELTLGEVGRATQRSFFMLPSADLCKFHAQPSPGASGAEVKVWCVCISGWGNSIGVGLTHKRAGEKKKNYVVVMSASSLHILMVAMIDFEPRALCIDQEKVTVMGDNAQPASYAEKDAQIVTLSAITGAESGRAHPKVMGQTLGLTASGTQRVAQLEDGRIVIEQIDSGETIFLIQDHTLNFKGVGAAGKLLALVRPDDFAHPGLFLKDINNMDRFGPSLETCHLWFLSHGGNDVTAADVALTLSRYKLGLPKWPLLFLEDWSEALTLLLNLCVRDRDYGAFKVVIESCPHFWAGVSFIDVKEFQESQAPTVFARLPTALGGQQDESPGGDDSRPKTVLVPEPKSFWSKALENNDKIFVQMLLDGVLDMVGAGDTVPVREMEQVTKFIVDSIEAEKMQEKVESFLMDLPLLPVSNKTHHEKIEEVFAEFPGGDVIKTAWSTRSAPLSATAFSFQVGKAEGKGERGYRYVSALPGLTRMETLAAFTSSSASPALVDNETMRNTIDALEETTADKFLGMAWDWTLFPFLCTLTAFCLMVILCVTSEKSFAQIMHADALTAEQFGLLMGCFAVVGHIIILYFEFIEFKTGDGPWWVKVAGYFSGGFWNVLPFMGNVMGIITMLLLVNDNDKEQIRSVAAFSMIFLWFNLFNYLRAYRKGSALVKMLIEIMFDMGYFVGVVLVLLLSFAGGFYALHGNLNPTKLGIEAEMCDDEPAPNLFQDLANAFANTFLAAILGAFEIDQFRSPLDLARDESNGTLTTISFFLFVLLVMLVSVVALNALIAIMGSTYGRVEEAQQAVTYKEIASIMHDKLCFRHFHEPGARERFERDNRWTHVLSPSESGSMPQARAISKGNGNPVIGLKKDIRDNQNKTEAELGKLQELMRSQEGGGGGDGGSMDTEALSVAFEQIGTLPGQVQDIKHDLADVHKNIEEMPMPPWASDMMASILSAISVQQTREAQSGGGDGIQLALRELNDVKREVVTLKQGLEEQWDAYNDMRVRLDAQGLQGHISGQPAPSPRRTAAASPTPSVSSRRGRADASPSRMRYAAHAALVSRSGEAPAPSPKPPLPPSPPVDPDPAAQGQGDAP